MPPAASDRRLVPSLLFMLTLSAAGPAVAQGQQGCVAPEYRQFDFWVGSWSVTTPKGQAAGTNRVEKVLGGCVLQEHWASSNGGDGTSLNMWNAADSTWRQVWMDAGGNLLELKGKLVGKEMVLSGTRPTAGQPDQVTIDRVTWTPLANGTVRQLWESSTDGGGTWTTAFDGLYAREP
jgi:hypothetical protein